MTVDYLNQTSRSTITRFAKLHLLTHARSVPTREKYVKQILMGG